MNIDLEKLMSLKGAIASSEFGADGTIVASRGDISAECTELMKMMSSTNAAIRRMEVKMEAMGSTNQEDTAEYPFKGWALSAGDYSICVMGNAGVFVKTGLANFKGIFRTLGKEIGAI